MKNAVCVEKEAAQVAAVGCEQVFQLVYFFSGFHGFLHHGIAAFQIAYEIQNCDFRIKQGDTKKKG